MEKDRSIPSNLSDALSLFKEHLDEEKRRFFKRREGSIKDVFAGKKFNFETFVEQLLTLPDEYDEATASFLSSVYKLPLMNSVPDTGDVDMGALSSYGFVNARNNLLVHLTEGRLLAAAPFVKDIKGRKIIIAPRRVVLKLLDAAETLRGDDVSQLLGKEISIVFSEIVQKAVREGASDIHIEYNELLKMTMVKFRKDGVLVPVFRIHNDTSWHNRLVNYIMVRAGINPGEYVRLHDGQLEVEMAKRVIPLRVSLIPTLCQNREPILQVSVRIMASEGTGIETNLLSLGFSRTAARKLERIVQTPNGMFIVCGPTGSGKNTTMYALINILMENFPIKIISIEDPVEKRLVPDEDDQAGVVQIDVDPKKNITFVSALRSVLRHDPDVIFIGEIRDEETAREAVKAGITGHLVLSTLHTNSSVDVVGRLTQTLGVHPDLVESVMRCVLAQRLVRKICPECGRKVPAGDVLKLIEKGHDPDAIYRRRVVYAKEHFQELLDEEILKGDDLIVLPVGCPFCNDTGFLGRTVMWETILFTPEVRNAVFREKKSSVEILNMEGCEAMAEVALSLVREGVTSVDEVIRFVDILEHYRMKKRLVERAAGREKERGGLVIDLSDFRGGHRDFTEMVMLKVKEGVGELLSQFRREREKEQNEIRELLKKAAEEVEKVKRLADEQSSAREKLSAEAETLSGTLEKVKELEKRIGERLEEDRKEAGELEKKVKGELEKTAGRVKELEEKIEKLIGETADSLTSLEKKITREIKALNERVREKEKTRKEGELLKELEEVKRKWNEYDELLEKIGKKLEKTVPEDKLLSLEKSVRSLSQKIGDIENLVQTVKERAVGSDDLKAVSRAVVSSIETALQDANARIGQIESTTAYLLQSVQALIFQVNRMVGTTPAWGSPFPAVSETNGASGTGFLSETAHLPPTPSAVPGRGDSVDKKTRDLLVRADELLKEERKKAESEKIEDLQVVEMLRKWEFNGDGFPVNESALEQTAKEGDALSPSAGEFLRQLSLYVERWNRLCGELQKGKKQVREAVISAGGETIIMLSEGEIRRLFLMLSELQAVRKVVEFLVREGEQVEDLREVIKRVKK